MGAVLRSRLRGAHQAWTLLEGGAEGVTTGQSSAPDNTQGPLLLHTVGLEIHKHLYREPEGPEHQDVFTDTHDDQFIFASVFPYLEALPPSLNKINRNQENQRQFIISSRFFLLEHNDGANKT